MGVKKDKKKDTEMTERAESDLQDELLIATTDLQSQPEEMQFTDTSYTSASFESLPPVVEEPKEKKKKSKKKVDEIEVVTKHSSEQFNWSEEELSVVEEQPKVAEAEPPKKKKKGKKEKVVEEIPNFPKPKNWKSMSKQDRTKWLEQQIDEWRLQLIAEKQALLASVKEKRAQAAKDRATLMAKDHEEQEVRRDILAKTVALFTKFEREKLCYQNKKQERAEWDQYLRCDGLPDPRVVTQMNTYLHLWRHKDSCDDNELEKRCVEVLPMLEMLEEFVANSRQYTALQAESYNEVRLGLRAQLSEAIQCASYFLLRDIEKNLNMDSVKLSTYEREFKGLRLNVWVAVKMPTRKLKPVEPEREPVELSFPSMKVSVTLPKIIDASCICVRAARSMVDLLSENARTFKLLQELPNQYQDLFIYNVKEHVETYKLKKEQDEIRTKFFKEIKVKVKELETFLKNNPYTKNTQQEEELDNLNLLEPPFLPDPRTFITEQNELAFKKYLKMCMTKTRTGEVNLRKYRICAGILNLDLLTTPPQPKRLRDSVQVTTLSLPKTLQPMPYQVQYRAPSPPPQGVTRTPEEIETEMKKVEAQYEKLALVYIELPSDVLWSEPPMVCQWQDARNSWTSNYINDYKFNEDKLTVQFRTGVLWPIGLATLRYSNMPYQGWELKPDPFTKGVLVTVTGLCVTVTWLCLGNSVRLRSIQNASNSALTEHFKKPYSVKRMLQIMREAACDFFPDFDAHNHIEGTCPKEWVIERHNYHAIAFLSRAYNFQWSRWNAAAGSRNLVMQIREAVDRKRVGKLELLYVNPQQATILKCNEMSYEFSTEPMVGLGFYPDLFTLNMTYGSVDARRTVFGMKYRLVETVFELLQELKISSFS